MYHDNVIRSGLTRSIAATFDQVHDEIVGAWEELIPVANDGMWHTPEYAFISNSQSRMGQDTYPTNYATNNLSCL